jgi:hypothetical protein
MPEISRFLGIVIAMYHNEHGPAHFHVFYGGRKATIEIESERIRGDIPPRIANLALEWARLHRAELLENWRRARAGEVLVRIPPLE